MKVAVYGQYYKSEAIEYMHILFEVLKEHQIEFHIEQRFSELIIAEKDTPTFGSYHELDDSFFRLRARNPPTALLTLTDTPSTRSVIRVMFLAESSKTGRQ